MRTKKTEQYFLLTVGDPYTASRGYASIEELTNTERPGEGRYTVIIGRAETLTIETKTVHTLGSAPVRKSRTRQTAKGSVTTAGEVPLKKDGTPKRKPGRKTTAEKMASKTEPLIEHVAESRNGKSEHVGEEVQS